MTDNFAILSQPRRPWLDPGPLKEKFLALSADIHPDRVHSLPEEHEAGRAGFTEVNAAYHCLQEPRDRVRHLLELELGHKPDDLRSIPPELAEAAFKVGTACKAADAFLAERAAAATAISRVGYFERGQACAEELLALQRTVQQQREVLLEELKAMNAAWETAPADRPLKRLEEIYRLLGYFGKWTGEIKRRMVELFV